MLVSAIVHDLSVDLNDQIPGYEYTRWPESQLAVYVAEALLHLADLPEVRRYFTKRVIIPVESGYVWQGACADCTRIVRILGESNSSGIITKRLRRIEDEEDFEWAGDVFASCGASSPKDYSMNGYSINIDDPSQFMVTPPVPAGQTHYVVAECYQQPDGTDMFTDVPDVLVALVKQWALYRAFSVDSENSPTITDVAERHRATFFKLIESMLALEDRKVAAYGADRSGVRGVQEQARK